MTMRHRLGRTSCICLSLLAVLQIRVSVVSYSTSTLVSTEGITSLLLDIEQTLYCGTKRGKVFQCHWSGASLKHEGILDDNAVKPYPVYSMAMKYNKETSKYLFCGGGDRYVSVYEQQPAGDWALQQLLGPHTGWVKDVLFIPKYSTLISIGCNCVESWKQSDSPTGGWIHIGKCSIESSPQLGATLSSDLLCLCEGPDGRYFYAGGVDGRLHLWTTEHALSEPIASIGAHNGRVCVLLFAPESGLLFSTGHDGVLQCRNVENIECILPDKGKVEYNLADCLRFNVEEVKWTAWACLHDSQDEVSFVLGSANGKVVRVVVTRSENDDEILTIDCDLLTELPGQPVVHALCALPTAHDASPSSSSCLAIGHSSGLTLLDQDLQ